MSENFRGVTIEPHGDDGVWLLRWESPGVGRDEVFVYPEDYGGAEGALAAATELHARLTSPLLDPLPEGVEWVRRAPADVVRELGWEWWDGLVWVASIELSSLALGDLVCRPPQAKPVTVTLPADASDEDIVAAFRAAGSVS